MFAPGFRPLSRNGPDCRVHVDLAPRHVPDLARSSSGQDQELKGQFDSRTAAGGAHSRDGAGNFSMRQGRMMALAYAILPGQHSTDGLAGRVVLPEALGHGPFHDGRDALAHTPRGYRLGMPDRHKHAEDFCRIDIRHPVVCPGADRRRCVTWSSHCDACLALRQLGRCSSMTAAAAASKVGILAWRRRSIGSPPARAILRLASAFLAGF